MKHIISAKGTIYLKGSIESGGLPTDIDIPMTSVSFISGDYIASPASSIGEELLEALDKSNLRDYLSTLSDEDYRAVSQGVELVNWSEEEVYCATCGSQLQIHREGFKTCPECNREFFPRLSPAILVLVRRGDEALLVHARNFSREMMALVAGFVECGETLEQCVAREVKEETSLEIKNIRYFGSQSWPYPHQLMIAFTADYAGGEICFADGELDKGGFFRADSLPDLPTPPSLSRALIDDWISRQPDSDNHRQQ